MKLAVTGGRNFGESHSPLGIRRPQWSIERGFAFKVLDELHAETPITCVIHGACYAPAVRGADNLADEWAKLHSIAVLPVPVLHSLDGEWPGAGSRRNQRMLEHTQPDKLLALPGHAGTADCVRRAIALHIPVVDRRG